MNDSDWLYVAHVLTRIVPPSPITFAAWCLYKSIKEKHHYLLTTLDTMWILSANMMVLRFLERFVSRYDI